MTEENDNSQPVLDNRPQKGNRTGLLIAFVVVLTVVAILLVPTEKPKQGDQQSRPASGERPSLLSPGSPATRRKGSSAASPAAQKNSQEKDLGPGSAARRQIRELRSHTPIDLERAFKAAQAFQKKGQLDDAYLMYFFAAREGYGPAAMILAREADPATFHDGGLYNEPDELQANKWYSHAQQAGAPGAAAALARLRTAVEQKAQTGDERARRIMLQWK